MNLDALRAGHKAEHVVSEDRVAALGHLVFHTLYVLRAKDEDVIAAGCRIGLRLLKCRWVGTLGSLVPCTGFLLDVGFDIVGVAFFVGNGSHHREH